MTEQRLGLPDLGVGVGLRVPNYRYILENQPEVDFFEIISENFMVEGGKPVYHLDRVLENYRVVQHGVSMGIGGPEPPDKKYLARLKELHQKVKGPWLSDHFCWTGVPGTQLHDLLPLPATKEAARIVSDRARMVQDFLGVRFSLENASSYMAFTSTEMPEWEFVSEVLEKADIGLMFDVNNIYVAAYNHGFDPYEYVNNVPQDRIVQIHVAGHTNLGTHIVDTHTGHVIPPVWDLYRYTIECAGPVSTIIEWDTDIPEFPKLMQVAAQARAVRDEAVRARDHRVARGKDAKPPEKRGGIPDHPPPDLHRQPHRLWEQGGPREFAARDPEAIEKEGQA